MSVDPLLPLTHEQMIGEAFMPRLEVDQYVRDGALRERIQAMIRGYRVSGFCIFGGTAETVRKVTDELRAIAAERGGPPLIFSADFEFGLPMRLTSGGTEYPDAMALGRAADAKLIYDIARSIADEMKAVGVDWNFAPVVDVNSNPNNPVINTRSFGEDAATVTRFALPFIHGLQESGVAATVKHFPGHGDTTVDSHRDLPIIDASLERFLSLELPPFQAAIDHGVWSVMLGHIRTPTLCRELGASGEESELPSTFNPIILRTLLRERLGFTGVVVSDSFEMHAITKYFEDHTACLESYKAGMDILLNPLNPERAYEEIVAEFRAGNISVEHIEASCRRVLDLKRKALEVSRVEPISQADERTHRAQSLNAARGAIQETEGQAHSAFAESRVLILVDDREASIAKAAHFEAGFRQRFPAADVYRMTPDKFDRGLFETVLPLSIITFHRARGYLDERAEKRVVPSELAHLVAAIGTKPIELLVLFGSPYLDRFFCSLETHLLVKTYSESYSSIEAVLELLAERAR